MTVAVDDIGTTVLYTNHTYVSRVVGYFDKPTNAATLPLIQVYDHNSASDLPAAPLLEFIPDHDKDKESSSVFEINLGSVLFTKGIVVVVGAFVGSTGALYVVHD
jgi:hypothetical protein